jgi:hypothetical protein
MNAYAGALKSSLLEDAICSAMDVAMDWCGPRGRGGEATAVNV